jgi:hypothetical protein
MILRLTPKTAALVGETPAEGQLLEKEVRAGCWTTGHGLTRTDSANWRRILASFYGEGVRADAGTEASPPSTRLGGALGREGVASRVRPQACADPEP